MRITDLTQRRFERRDQTRARIYFFPSGNIPDDRKVRIRDYRAALAEALLLAGLHPALAGIAARAARWSRTAGCSCGCSPGFLLPAGAAPARADVYVDVAW